MWALRRTTLRAISTQDPSPCSTLITGMRSKVMWLTRNMYDKRYAYLFCPLPACKKGTNKAAKPHLPPPTPTQKKQAAHEAKPSPPGQKTVVFVCYILLLSLLLLLAAFLS